MKNNKLISSKSYISLNWSSFPSSAPNCKGKTFFLASQPITNRAVGKYFFFCAWHELNNWRTWTTNRKRRLTGSVINRSVNKIKEVSMKSFVFSSSEQLLFDILRHSFCLDLHILLCSLIFLMLILLKRGGISFLFWTNKK